MPITGNACRESEAAVSGHVNGASGNVHVLEDLLNFQQRALRQATFLTTDLAFSHREDEGVGPFEEPEHVSPDAWSPSPPRPWP